MERINRKFETAVLRSRPHVEPENQKSASLLTDITLGLLESRDQLRYEYNIETDYLR